MSWFAIVILAAGAYGFKAVGVLGLSRLGGGAPDAPGSLGWLPVIASLIPAALFAALIAVQTLAVDGSLHIDARLAGVSAAGVAVARRAPFVVVVVVAMTVTAAIRWQT